MTDAAALAGVLRTDEDVDHAADFVLNYLIDDLTLGVSFEVHRSAKIGTFALDELDRDSEKNYQIVDKPGYDIFGQVATATKKQFECVCPNCDRNLAASRFAPHLEKCMGMGRNSSRLANRRLMAANTNNNNSNCSSNNHNSNSNSNSSNNHHRHKDSISDIEDNEDEDWTLTSESKRSTNRRKRDHKGSHNSPRKPKISKSAANRHAAAAVDNPGSSSSCGSGSTNYAGMVADSTHSPASSTSSLH